ncbi:hypothetical protein JZU56_05060, partial [bacterium]|nr:hypothetical protein [bacterium]
MAICGTGTAACVPGTAACADGPDVSGWPRDTCSGAIFTLLPPLLELPLLEPLTLEPPLEALILEPLTLEPPPL